MPPTVPPRPQVRRAPAQVWRQSGRHLDDALAEQCRLDHHLAGKLHAETVQFQALKTGFRQRAQSAMCIADSGMEKNIKNSGQRRISNISVLPRHRPELDAALETGTHAEIGAV